MVPARQHQHRADPPRSPPARGGGRETWSAQTFCEDDERVLGCQDGDTRGDQVGTSADG